MIRYKIHTDSCSGDGLYLEGLERFHGLCQKSLYTLNRFTGNCDAFYNQNVTHTGNK